MNPNEKETQEKLYSVLTEILDNRDKWTFKRGKSLDGDLTKDYIYFDDHVYKTLIVKGNLLSYYERESKNDNGDITIGPMDEYRLNLDDYKNIQGKGPTIVNILVMVKDLDNFFN